MAVADPADTVWVEQAHADAILALLRAAPPAISPLVVHDGVIDPPPTDDDRKRGYIVAHIATSTPSGTSLNSVYDRAVTRAYLHCIGMTATSARAIAGRATNALLNITPEIASRACFPIRDDGSDTPPEPDRSSGKTYFDRMLVLRLESVPSRALAA